MCNLNLFSLPLGSAALAQKGARIAFESDKRNLERIVLRIAAVAEIDPIASCDALGQADLVSRAGGEENPAATGGQYTGPFNHDRIAKLGRAYRSLYREACETESNENGRTSPECRRGD